MIYLPQNRNWKSLQGTDVFGTVVETRNITFDEKGYARISNRLVNFMSDEDDTDLGPVVRVIKPPSGAGFKIFNENEPFTVSDMTTLPTQDTATDHADDVEDAEMFNGNLYTFEDTGTSANVTYLDSAGAYTDLSLSFPTLNSGRTPLAAKVFRNLNKLALGVMNRVRLLQTDNTLDATNDLTISSNFRVTSLEYNNNNLYIATWDTLYNRAYVFAWNGSGTSAQYGFPVPNGTQIYSIKAYDSSVAILTSGGQLLRFTGNGFQELGSLPVYFDQSQWNDDDNYNKSSNRGMFVDGDLIYINIESLLENGAQDYIKGQISGVWCYDPSVGLYHRYALGSSRRVINTIATASVNTTSDTITVTADTYSRIVTGTPVHYSSANSTELTGLKQGSLYYTIKDTTNTIKLATSKTLAEAGTSIDLTGTGNNSQKLIFYPENNIADLTATLTRYVEALNSPADADRRFFERIIAGGTVTSSTSLSTDYDAAFMEVPGLPNVSELVFAKIPSSQIEDNTVSVIVKYENLFTVDDKIVVKYKSRDYAGLPIMVSNVSNSQGLPTGTWTDSNTLTSTCPNLSYALAGDEITFMTGSGAGHIRHIESITESSGTYTINLTETVPQITTNDVCAFKVDRWTKVYTVTSSEQTQGYARVALGQVSKFFQIKLEIRGISGRNGVKVEEVLINNVTHKPVI